MFQIVFPVVAFSLLAGAWGLECNQCNSAAGSTNKCDSPANVTCNMANSMQTQAALVQYFNTSVDSASTDFQCMSLNTTVNTGDQNVSISIEGCLPESYDVCKLSVLSSYTEDRTSCSTCGTDTCNKFVEETTTPTPTEAVSTPTPTEAVSTPTPTEDISTPEPAVTTPAPSSAVNNFAYLSGWFLMLSLSAYF